MRFFRSLILVVILILVGVTVYIWFERVNLASKALSHVLKTEVKIKELDLSVSLGTLTVKGLQIRNPPKTDQKNALEVGTIFIKIKPLSLFKDVIVIDEVLLDRVLFNVELYNLTGSDNNWSRIINNATEDSSTKTDPTPKKNNPSSQEEDKDPTRFVLHLFLAKDLKFNLVINQFVKTRVNIKPLDKFEIKDIGKEQPVTGDQLANIISTQILTYFSEQVGMNSLLKNTTKLPQNLYRGIKSDIKNPENIIKDIGEGAKGTKNFFKNLFSHKPRKSKSKRAYT